MIAISNHVFSFEPVLRWYDEWLPVHQRTPEPAHLKKLTQPDANPEGRALVEKIRSEVVSLFRRAWVQPAPRSARPTITMRRSTQKRLS